jgi:hypothetical protein
MLKAQSVVQGHGWFLQEPLVKCMKRYFVLCINNSVLVQYDLYCTMVTNFIPYKTITSIVKNENNCIIGV